MSQSSPDIERMKRDLAALVAINTENPPGREREAAECISTLLQAAGFSLSLSDYQPGRTNVIARLENGPGPCFAFNTHIDVVPAGEGWSQDPFTLTERDGRLYGRGACDAKGPMVAMIEAMRMLANQRHSWTGTLMGIFVADEEVASFGARHYVAAAPAAIDYVVIGEPTSNTTYSAHKGSLRPLVRVHGVTAHSGTPELGENAILRAAQLLGLVEHEHQHHVSCRSHPLVGNASLTVTRISGGHADNVLPGACDLLLDRRMVPGEDEARVKQEICDLLALAEAKFGVRSEIVSFKPTTGGATETAFDDAIVQAGVGVCRARGNPTPGPLGFQGGCDLVHFASLGAKGIILGPGSLSVAHKPDEFIPVDEWVTGSLIYRDVALAMMPR
ncbi:M20 family metallopeptidase [Biostraticola tofi]|uniref:Acetylornithine deacetylase/succinyl-diaminopimelate desuccinylase n=1 Tax=Biostraticola tofi TaxID=466109 RepID=A0A4R3YRU8_9GAMM|nr:M20 family metallopeptidase [Biostraticola tofi]TCV95171.1 acetylornithine deacetylase/succinyl-diaminopimelate desuccinylase [Biostraticola tofi]